MCQTRWIESVGVCSRAIEVYNIVKDYLAKTKKLPDTKTVETIKTGIQDPLTVPKIMVFSSVASLVEPYLRKVPSPQPMVPFVYGELIQVLPSLYSRFIKAEIIEEVNTTSKLLKLVIPARLILVLVPTSILKRESLKRKFQRCRENLFR